MIHTVFIEQAIKLQNSLKEDQMMSAALRQSVLCLRSRINYSKTVGKTTSVSDVPGLSDKVLSVPSDKVGPGASKSADYKNPEYFCYNVTSYHQAEVEMVKYRLPQPSSKK